ncbi:cytochrome c heme-lyase [Paramicrosporidium saccamoebae]|uniref:Holocytochrome c-type synthase n=1 Tax=Paramicrosporidium saccamoebae TaxID=1246581 RepID=A0A2H9TPY6_9FUNG|nr:cytochrome c heme-lyase [Paramicrosporidium saccamoebae]
MSCPRDSSSAGHACAVPIDERNQMPTDLDRLVEGMSSARIGSSIPRADASATWLYPSPQMFFNALRRKGHTPQAEDMEVIVTIHNMVNEQTWQKILCWERYYHPNADPKLSRFLGRPDQLSPRAWFRTWLLGYTRPFDRHDWYVEREGKEVRYVIDFYSGGGDGASFHIDARPALDSVPACYERMHCFSNKILHRLRQTMDRLLKSDQL